MAPTGYARLAQAELHSDSDSDPDTAPLTQSFASLPAPGQRPSGNPRASSQPRRSGRRRRASSAAGVDIGAINARLERWAEDIAAKFKKRTRTRPGEETRLEIHHSVFQAPEGVVPIGPEGLAQAQPGMTKDEFEEIVESVRKAIDRGVHPTMISQGSSGSYFARNSDGKVVGVFKPKDEEPYAAGNPKWNKWIHRNLFPCFFGRACLIPNLSYVSEAAAYTLDCQLRTHMVPYTDVVYLSSKSFHYPFWDRNRFTRKTKELPEKPGSFQVFLKGFKDANIFLRENPWPDQYRSGFRTGRDGLSRTRSEGWTDACRPTAARAAAEAVPEPDYDPEAARPLGPDNFQWTDQLKQSFREELEKLVILDYMMRNTDRGLDNWMVKVDWSTQQVSIQSEPLQFSLGSDEEEEEEEEDLVGSPSARPAAASRVNEARSTTRSAKPYRQQMPMKPSAPTTGPQISIGAIDNSLSWPWKHPDAWRSFPFGWLFLPVDLIGRPFSQKTRDHFLPLLTSPHWWSQTHYALRRVFEMDSDFQERMFEKQMAVMKGQAWNVVETLKDVNHGPLELTRRARVCVWDDLVDVPVAVPMRATSSEIHRTRQNDTFDIGAARMDGTGDLAGLPGAGKMPSVGRFELTSTSPPRERLNMYSPERGGAARADDEQQRRYSYATPATRKQSNSIAHALYGDLESDDIEGDLGYAAAQGMEGQMRRVIVERLEAVKSRNPVFTWC